MIWLLFLLVQGISDEKMISHGENLFTQNCSVGYCHGVGGSAGAGPRLRDRELDENYLYQVIREGIPQSAMPGWKDRLSEQDVLAVASYVMSLSSAKETMSPVDEVLAEVEPTIFANFSGPPQTRPGRDLFFDATRGVRCATCHFLGGMGIPIGPDLKRMGLKDPTLLLSLIRSNQSQHVLTARMKNGEVFPALRATQNKQWVKLYDLTSPLPVLRTLERSEITSIAPANDWGHESVVRHYKDRELATIISYLQWVSSTKQ